MNDTIAGLLATLQNNIMRRKETAQVTVSKMNKAILDILLQEEMIEGYEVNENNLFSVELKYRDNGEPEVQSFKRISKPSQRIYTTAKELLPVMNGRGISIVSTSSGLMSGAMAKSKGVGGELICEIW
jgi:small subunit ribosomal protein S8